MKLAVLLVSFAIVISGCKQPDAATSAWRQPSPANRATLVFDGEQMNGQIFPKAIYLEDESKVKTAFSPRDPASVEQSAFTLQPVWSPDQQWLLLPDGRFYGFAAFEAKELPAALTDTSKAHRIGICGLNGTKWWHEFTEWKSPSVFGFKAGLSGQLFSFECDVTSGAVTAIDKTHVGFRMLSE